jgi:hypothetical protein
MEKLEDGLFDAQSRTAVVQRRTYQIRKDLVQLRRVTLPMRELVNTVLRHRRETGNDSGAADLNSSYDDLYDHVLRVAEWTESLRDMITTIFETNLSLQDARLNTVMKKLTAWAAIIAVPTAITGYFGQNVLYPGYGTQWGFVFSTAVIAVIAAGSISCSTARIGSSSALTRDAPTSLGCRVRGQRLDGVDHLGRRVVISSNSWRPTTPGSAAPSSVHSLFTRASHHCRRCDLRRGGVGRVDDRSDR